MNIIIADFYSRSHTIITQAYLTAHVFPSFFKTLKIHNVGFMWIY